jgi:toxin ParE1/3/4
MARLFFAPAAQEDLQALVEFIARDKPQAARRWPARLRERCRLLAKNPGTGERRPEFLSGECRSFSFGNYVIFLRPVPRGIEIVRVVRAERDLRSL